MPGPMACVEAIRSLGVPFRITSPARTIVDCFRYRTRKVGLDVALEALHDGLRQLQGYYGGCDLMRTLAEVCRVHDGSCTALDLEVTLDGEFCGI